MAVQSESGGGSIRPRTTTTTPPAWMRLKPGAVQPRRPRDAYYNANPTMYGPPKPQGYDAEQAFGNQQGGPLPAWATPRPNQTMYGPPKPQGYDAEQAFGNQQGGPLPAWATPRPNTPSTNGNRPTTPAPFYTAAQLPNKKLPQWMQDKGEQFAFHNAPEEYMAAAAATQTPQYPYLNDPAEPVQPAPFMTLNDFMRTTQPTPPIAPTGTGFGSQYNWGSRLANPRKGGGGGGWSDGGGSGYIPSWLMNLYSWNFKG